MQYEQAELKKNLPDVQGLDFEIHDEHALMRVKTRNGGPTAIIKMGEMPKTTIELINIVRSAFFLELHPSCSGFTMTSAKAGSYTRTIDTQSELAPQARQRMGMSELSAAPQFVEDMARAGTRVMGSAAKTESKLPPFEWGSSKDGAKRLREDVVKKTANIFKQF